MKKLIFFIFFIINFLNNSIADTIDRDHKLNKLFDQLKDAQTLPNALPIENKIWKIWSTHPSQKVLTNFLTTGTALMNKGELVRAYNIFSNIVEKEPD